MTYQLHCGSCLDWLPTLAAESIDAVITDPPYPEIDRDYGMLTEDEWWALMMGVCAEVRRVLKPTGSAVFILQPNSRKVGSMRGWLWEFMAWVCRDWNMVQDAYWWNTTARTVGVSQWGLMRPSVKPCIWAGAADCYRNQTAVLWGESERNRQVRAENRAYDHKPVVHPSTTGGPNVRIRMAQAAADRGGVTAFNLLPVPNSDSATSSGAHGHGAGTPLELADWWVRYIVPPGGIIVDPFNGAGTMGVAALRNGAHYIGIEKMPKHIESSRSRLDAALAQPLLLLADSPIQPQPTQAAMFVAAQEACKC